MKTQLLPAVLTAIVAVSSCTTEDYYRSANRSAELLMPGSDRIDTIKTGSASKDSTIILTVTAADENGNMNLLTTFADGGKTEILNRMDDGDNEAIESIELLKERYNFTRQIEFSPAVDGRHTINVRVRDDFGNVTSMEKLVYSFTNMPPKVKVAHSAERINFETVRHISDYSKSFDRDSMWGGNIDSLFLLFKSTADKNIFGEDIEHPGKNLPLALKVSDYDPNDQGLVHISKYVIHYELYDGDEGYFNNIYMWVKDNEGMPSDTVHISIGHVENSIARQEYEER